MATKEDVLKVLSTIIDPDFKKDIVTLGFIKQLKIEDGVASFDIELTTPACPLKEQFEKQATELVSGLEGISGVKITMTAREVRANREVSGLDGVKSIIAVASCKGGVGKSTTSATIACELASRGFKVGLLDADLFGPSVPTLFNLQKEKVRQKNEMLQPIEVQNGLKVMSFGFLLGDAAAIMRGPMVSGYVQQLLHQVEWGELDYLFIDMPPGTGDIQLTISQAIRLNGAVIVTTRASLSLVDVAKGILMFEKVDIPMLGVIENMAYFMCDNCDKQHFIFGEQKSTLSDRFGLETLAHVPIERERGKTFDNYVTNETNKELVDGLVREVGRQMIKEFQPPTIDLNKDNVVFNWSDGKKTSISNLDLRDKCSCALCVDEFTGVKTLDRETIPKDIHGLEVIPLGNYAVSIKWSDGHSSSIYPYKKIAEFNNK